MKTYLGYSQGEFMFVYTNTFTYVVFEQKVAHQQI
jgi:hypothetical protein